MGYSKLVALELKELSYLSRLSPQERIDLAVATSMCVARDTFAVARGVVAKLDKPSQSLVSRSQGFV